MHSTSDLDNPIWHALTTVHEWLAQVAGRARRYPSDVSPFAGLERPTADGFDSLRSLVSDEESVALFTAGPLDVPADWEVVRTRVIEQMVCRGRPSSSATHLVELGADDVPSMLALTALTEPGPFLPGTMRMGRYLGIRDGDGRLVAMAGERLATFDAVEISAVCTDPAFRGRGYAGALIANLVGRALDASKTPFLHVKGENRAKHVYEGLGFTTQSSIHVTVIRPRG